MVYKEDKGMEEELKYYNKTFPFRNIKQFTFTMGDRIIIKEGLYSKAVMICLMRTTSNFQLRF